MKYSIYKSEEENITAGFYEPTGTTSTDQLKEYGYEFVCYAETKKEAEKLTKNLWAAK